MKRNTNVPLSAWRWVHRVLLTPTTNNLIKTTLWIPPHTSLHLPLLPGCGCWMDIEYVGGSWGTTSTCLAGCWCSHRPLTSCHLWGRREAAGTLRGSCSPAHSATESLAHQRGRRKGGGDNISIIFAKCFKLVLAQTTFPTPEGKALSWRQQIPSKC